MTPQERDQLAQFLRQLTDARGGEKNAEAEAMIRDAVSKQPEAAYLLVQRAMLVEQALNAAKAQIAQLQGQLQSAQSTSRNSGFLGGGNPWAQSLDTAPASSQVPGASGYQIPRAAPMAGAAPVQAAAGGGAGSFLGSVATTAAGVVAGSFLFQGIENLLGHHQSSGFSGWGDTPGEHVSEQTIINNYYETTPEHELARNDDWSQPDDVAGFLADSDSSYDDGDDSGWA